MLFRKRVCLLIITIIFLNFTLITNNLSKSEGIIREEILGNFDIIFKKKWFLFNVEGWTRDLAMIEYIARKK